MTVKLTREQIVTGWKKWEKIFLSVEFLAIVILAILLYADFQTRLDAGVREQVGIITFKQKTVQRKYSGRAVWESMESSFPLYNKDSIRTGDFSDAEITLNDGTKLEVDENTLIMLNISKEEKEIDFAYGALTTKRSGDLVSDDGGSLSIRSGGSLVALNKADVSISQNKGESLLVDVKSGIANLLSGDQKKEISVDEKIEIQGEEIKVSQKPFRVVSPASNFKSIFSGDWVNIEYNIEGWNNSKTAVLEFSRSRDFKNVFYKRSIPSEKFSEPFKPGIYYWRAVDGGKVASVGKVNLVKVVPSNLINPVNNKKYFTSKEQVFIPFSWSREEGVAQYILEISNDKNFENITIQKNSLGTSISLELPVGDFYWRVKSVIGSNVEPIYSVSQSISVSNDSQKAPPNLMHPKSGDELSATIISQSGISFFWSQISGYSSFELQISKRKDFSDPINLTTNSRNNLIYKDSIGLGEYFWRVRGVTSNGDKGDYSLASNFLVTDASKNVFNLQSDSSVSEVDVARDGIVLKWKKLPINGTYEVILAKDKDFKNVVRKVVTNLNQATIKELVTGKYYWKVSLLNEQGEPTLVSDYKSFDVSDKFGPIYPQTGLIINMTTKSDLAFRWQKRPGVTNYTIVIYADENGENKKILQKSTSLSEFLLDEIEILDQGKFIWEIFYDESGEKKKEFTSTFQIELDPLPENLELLTPKVQYAE
jgi:hypothetical protein